MRELIGPDIFHLAMESPVQPMHTLKVLLIDGTNGGPTTPESMHEWAHRALPSILPLTWQLTSRSHWMFGAPAWREVPGDDMDAHLHHLALDEPGDREALGRAVGEIQMGMLDRRKPLWELWLLTGLQSGRVAHVWKIHHSVADGSGCARILDQAYQHSADERAVLHEPPAEETHIGEEDMSLRGVLHRHAFRTRHLPAVLKQTRIAVKSSRALAKADDHPGQRVLSSPKVRYNLPLTPRRTTAAASLAMEDIKKVREAFGVTVNDVFLAVCGGAVRNHLEANGELSLKSSMTATVPVSIRREEEAAEYGNRMVFWGVCLNSTLPDPVERLMAIKASTRAARINQNRPGADGLLREWQDYPPLFKALNQVGVITSKIAGRPAYNMVVSNVKGPERLWADGAPIEEIASIGQLTTGIGLNMTGWSYCGAMTIGIVAVPEHEPDIWALADHLTSALGELVEAADRQQAQVS